MDRSNETYRLGSLPKAFVVPVLLALTVGFASGADRITDGPDRGPVPSVRPVPPQPVVPVPLRFGPARPSLPSPAAFTPDMPFSRAIEILRNSTQPPLSIVVLWREIEENAGIDRNTPIGIDGLQGLRLRQCIEVLLTSMSATALVRIGYVVQNGVVTIATVDSLPRPKPVTRVYDISDLVAPPSLGIGFRTMPGMMPGMMAGFGGMPYGGGGLGAGTYAPGYGGYGSGYGNSGTMPGYNGLGGLPGFVGGMQGMGVYAR